MGYNLLEGRNLRQRRVNSAVAFLRGLILLLTGLYAVSDPFEFAQLAFPFIGGVLIVDGILGSFALDLNDPARGRLVLGLARNTLEILAGLTILGGLTIVRLAPQDALSFWLSGVLALCGLVEIIPALVAPKSWRNLTSTVAGIGLLCIATMLFLSPGADLVALMSTIGGIVVILGLVLMSMATFQRSWRDHFQRRPATQYLAPLSTAVGTTPATMPLIRRTPNCMLPADPQRLIEAPLETFSSAGLTRGRLENIARPVGAAKGAVYLYFSSKQQLLDHLIEMWCLPDLPADAKDPQHSLETTLGEGSPAKVFRIVMMERADRPEIGTQYFDAMVKKLCRWPGVADGAQANELAQKVLADKLFLLVVTAGETNSTRGFGGHAIIDI